jgi:hypothetical protein
MTYLFRQGRILFQELDYAVRQLWVIHAQALHLVQREKHTRQEEFMLLF